MAQTDYTPILLYSSSTASQAPAAGNLTNNTLGSELAINITDGKLFYKDNANNVQVIAWKVTPTTAGGTGLTSYTAGDLLYYATGTTLSKLAIGAANTVLTSSGTAPQWSTNLNIGSLTATSISNSGNLTFTGTGNRITGDFSNATLTNRVAFQTSASNANTTINAIPNGTATTAQFIAHNNSDPGNASRCGINIGSTVANIFSDLTGTGTYLPMIFTVGGNERARITTAGNFGIGTNNPGYKLDVRGGSVANINSGGDATYFIGEGLGTAEYAFWRWDRTNNLTIFGTDASAPVLFFTNNLERARIFASGGVSIGNTTDPGATNLSVSGTTTAAIHNTSSGTTGSIANGASTDIYTTAANTGHYILSANAVGNTTVWCSYYIYFNGAGAATLVSIGAVGMTASSSGANKITLTNNAGSSQQLSWSINRYK